MESPTIERQKFQLHKNGYESVVKAIANIPKIEKIEAHTINLDLSETNSLLYEMLEKLNEPLCVKLTLE